MTKRPDSPTQVDHAVPGTDRQGWLWDNRNGLMCAIKIANTQVFYSPCNETLLSLLYVTLLSPESETLLYKQGNDMSHAWSVCFV